VIEILNMHNQQVAVRKSTIKGLSRDAPYGVFSKKRLRENLVIGTYRGETVSQAEFEERYPEGRRPRYVMELKPRVYVDARDPTKAGSARYINDPGPNRKANVTFVHNRERILVQTLRVILPGEELFVDYGDAYEWADAERKDAPTDASPARIAEAGGVPLEHMVHPRADDVALPDPHQLDPLVDEVDLRSGHRDFEPDSLILYADDDSGFGWLIGRIVAVDHARPLVEVHRLGSYELSKGKDASLCQFRHAHVDPKDGKQVYTNKPVRRYNPVYDHVLFAEIVERDFYLTNRERLPDHVARAAQTLTPPRS